MIKLNQLDFFGQMWAIHEYYDTHYIAARCPDCGGTGFSPVACCNKVDCTCKGIPIEYLLSCGICGRTGPETLPE